jgi:hypothetical protein
MKNGLDTLSRCAAVSSILFGLSFVAWIASVFIGSWSLNVVFGMVAAVSGAIFVIVATIAIVIGLVVFVLIIMFLKMYSNK